MSDTVKSPGSDATLPGAAARIAMHLFYALRVPVFLVLYWLRLPMKIVSSAVAGCSFVAAGIAYFAMPVTKVYVSLAVLSFVAFVAMWLYDLALMYLAPHEVITSL